MTTAPRHSIVLGAGVGGLSMAILLAKAGRRVTLLEKKNAIGGRLARFRRQGVPFDTGLHFTSSLVGILGQMLTTLDSLDGIVADSFPWALQLPDGHRLDFPNHGFAAHFDYLAQEFPHEAAAIRRYQALETEVLRHTPMFDLRAPIEDAVAAFSDLDQLALDALFRQLDVSPELAATLASTALYHGAPPEECPAARHFRVSYGFEEEMLRLRDGGDALVANFSRALARLGVAVRTNTHIIAFQEFDEAGHARCAELSDGTTLAFDDLFSSLHPAELLPLLPPERQRGFRRLCAPLQDTCGFFTIFATVDDGCPIPPHLASCIRTLDFNRILRPDRSEPFLSTGAILSHDTAADGTPVQCLILLAPAAAPPNAPQPTPAEKEAATQTVLEHAYEAWPELRGHLHLAAAATPHTYARYIPPGRGAYGVRMTTNAPRLMGRLPVRNFYGIGENAFAPGVVGTLLSSFLVARQVLGEEDYQRLLPTDFPLTFLKNDIY